MRDSSGPPNCACLERKRRRGPNSLSHVHTFFACQGVSGVHHLCSAAAGEPQPFPNHTAKHAPPSPPSLPCLAHSSRPSSHSSRRLSTDCCWVKFTGLCKLFDITNKVKVHRKNTRGFYYYGVQSLD